MRQLHERGSATRSTDGDYPGSALGERLRARRKGMGLSLKALADRVGVSASFLSQVERARPNPSFATLIMLSRALEVPAYYFLLESPDPVVRHDRRRKLTVPGSSLVYELLCPDLQGSMEVSLGRLGGGGVSSEQPLAHAAEEFILVLEGCLEIELGPRRYRLEPGDSIYHHGVAPHRYMAFGQEDVVFLSAVSLPIEVVTSPPGGVVDVK
ncbi:MAG: XRE family transcriptional regulator [Anaerolineae bacterium]|nr:XRE family transcriptional regulator [Anaerolineae bacterium]